MQPAQPGRQPSPPLIYTPTKWSSIELHAGEKIVKLQKLNAQVTAASKVLKEDITSLINSASKEERAKYKSQIAKNKKLFLKRLEGNKLPIDESMAIAEKIWMARRLPYLTKKIETESISFSRSLDTLAQKYSGAKSPAVLTNKPLVDSIQLRIAENQSKEYEQKAEIILAQGAVEVLDEALLRDLKKTEDKFDLTLKPILSNFVNYLNKVPGSESPVVYLLPLVAKSPLYAAHLLDSLPLDIGEAAKNYLIEKLNPSELAAFAKACVLYEGIKVLRKEKSVTDFLRGNSLVEAIPAYYQKLYLGPYFNEDEWTSFFLTCLSINSMELDPVKIEQAVKEENRKSIEELQKHLDPSKIEQAITEVNQKNKEEVQKRTLENQERILRKTTTSLDRVTAVLAKNRDVIPPQLKQLYQTAWDILSPLKGSGSNIQKKHLSSFFFLRFFNPQLISPVTPHHPVQQRDATHLAKILQSVSTNEIPNQEYMKFIETFIKERQPQIEAITTLLRE